MDGFAGQEVILLVALGIVIMLSFGLVMILFYYQTRRKLMQEALRNQQILLEKTILTQEKERKRIAKDLHDEVGGKLNVANLYLQQLIHPTPYSTEVQSASDGISDMLNAALAATRRISHDLLPPVLEEFGLEKALFDLAKNYSKADALTVLVEVKVDHFPIASPMVELNLFRIIQELVSNSIRHGEARQLSIKLVGDQKTMFLRYEDDGKGFNATSELTNQGLGMKNIESRLQIIKGNWQYTSQPGEAFQADIKIDLRA